MVISLFCFTFLHLAFSPLCNFLIICFGIFWLLGLLLLLVGFHMTSCSREMQVFSLASLQFKLSHYLQCIFLFFFLCFFSFFFSRFGWTDGLRFCFALCSCQSSCSGFQCTSGISLNGAIF